MVKHHVANVAGLTARGGSSPPPSANLCLFCDERQRMWYCPVWLDFYLPLCWLHGELVWKWKQEEATHG